MEASSQAYPKAAMYRRTSAVIDHGGGNTYVVDFFRVQGGARQDYVFHASAPTCEVRDARAAPGEAKLYDLSRVRAVAAAGPWRVSWTAGGRTCVTWNLPQPGERAFVADGWGQRDWKNSDIGATLPYIVRRTEGGDLKTFVSVFASHAGTAAFVRGVRVTDATGVVAIETANGTDLVMSHTDRGTLVTPATGGVPPLSGRFAVVSVQQGKVAWTFVEPAAP
jgi:hypothetical protein